LVDCENSVAETDAALSCQSDLGIRLVGRTKETKMILEIRAAEGGEDAKLLVEDQVTIYARVATRRGL
jgi:protein subunit release factor A